MSKCPKCQYQRKPSDSHIMPGICPGCGIAYNKYRQPEELKSESSEPVNHSFEYEETAEPILTRIKYQFLYTPDNIDEIGFWWRAALMVIFSVWGASFIFHGVSWEYIGSSFLHNANLPFHEFGHVLFTPFGDFMMILGGSLFQIILPLVFLFAFSIKQDNFSAAIMLWWCGQNFIDVSPYIKDAPYRAIPLIRGMSESAHDWGNLLTMSNSLNSANTIANISFTMGSILIILAMAWAGYLLIKIKKNLNQ